MAEQARKAARTLGRAIDWTTEQVRDVHLAIAKRPYQVLSRVPIVAEGAAVVEPIHRGITKATYGAVRAIAGGVMAVVEEIAERAPDPAIDDAGAVAVMNAVAGHELELGVTMGFRDGGREVAPEALAHGPHVVIFVHGLACDERSWSFWSDKAWGEPGISYGKLLERTRGVTALYVRYNTGLDVEENGRLLAALIDRLTNVERIDLVGHSMGGLVIGRACDEGLPWTKKVARVACLGSPHLGAPLAKLGAGAAVALASFDVTVPFSRILASRSRGVKALVDGYAAATALPNARVLLVMTSGFGPLGDGLVRVDSASGVSHHEKVVLERGHHGTLLNDPEVYAHLERFLGD